MIIIELLILTTVVMTFVRVRYLWQVTMCLLLVVVGVVILGVMGRQVVVRGPRETLSRGYYLRYT